MSEAPITPITPARRGTPSVQCKGGLFLTYSRYAAASDIIDKESIKATILSQLSSYVREGKCSAWDRGVVAVEQHKATESTTPGVSVPGMQHLHVFVHCKLTGCQMFRVKHTDLELNGHRGDYQQAESDIAVAKYVTKDGDYIWWGVDPRVRDEVRGMKRNLVLAELVDGDKSLVDAVQANPGLLLHLTQLEANLRVFRALKRVRPDGSVPQLYYLMGPSGAGKTAMAKSMAVDPKDIFIVPLPREREGYWFDGYQGESVVVFDNVSIRTSPPYDLICQMVDRSACRVPSKGGHVMCHPLKVVITSIYPPEQLWTMWDAQVGRRLTLFLEATPVFKRTPTVTSRGQFEPVVVLVDYEWKEKDLTPYLGLGLTTGTRRAMEALRQYRNEAGHPSFAEVQTALSLQHLSCATPDLDSFEHPLMSAESMVMTVPVPGTVMDAEVRPVPRLGDQADDIVDLLASLHRDIHIIDD